MKYEDLSLGPVALLAILTTGLLTGPTATASTYKLLYNFANQQDGGVPSGSVTRDLSGNLFGTTFQGGQFQEGVVYELSPNDDGTWTELVVHSFMYSEGDTPVGGVILDSSGNLYGTTATGGPARIGTVFELVPNNGTWTLNLIYDSVGGPLIFDKAGNLYGPVGSGDYLGGAIGELSPAPNQWAYSQLYSFCHNRPLCSDGIQPNAPLAWDAAGNLYGTTLHGGIYPYPSPCADNQGCGVAFQMRPRPDGSWSYRVLHWFGSFIGDGELLNGGMVVDSKGNVFGSSGVGGPTFSGTVFQLSPHPSGKSGPSTLYSETQLYTFPDCGQGCGPENPLVMDKAGNLYGTAGGGNATCAGNAYCGVVFRLAPQKGGTWKYTAIYKFSGPDGFGPAGVIVGLDGNLYGTTRMGGQFNFGVAFEITP